MKKKKRIAGIDRGCEILFYDGNQPIPAYFLIDVLPEKSLIWETLDSIIDKIRKMYNLSNEVPDRKISEYLYLLSQDKLSKLT